MLVVGDSRLPVKVMFSVKEATGKYHPSVYFYVSSFLEAEEIYCYFMDVRRVVGRRSSSASLFGGGYKKFSFEWLASHSVVFEVLDIGTDQIIESTFVQHPYLEKINNSVC